MNSEQSHTVEAVLQELRALTREIRLLRSELKEMTLSRSPDEAPSIVDHDSVSAFAEEEEVSVAYAWLASKGITVKNAREQNGADNVYDQLAGFLGDRFQNLVRVHDYIRRSLSTGSSFTLNLTSRSQEEIADSTQFCSMLSSYAFLSAYKYTKHTKTIYAAPQRVGTVINFFTGGWFERYIYLRIHSLLSQNSLEFTDLLNPQITFFNGDDFELDLLFLVGNQPLWVECKTGDYQAYITKYADTRKLLGVAKHRAILVILDIPSDLTVSLTHLYDITVANEDNFLEKVCAAVGLQEYPLEQEVLSSPIQASMPGNLSTLLNRAGLRPVPEFRQQIITELIKAAKSCQQPVTIYEMKLILADIVGASKSQLQDILRAMIMSGCLRDDEGHAVTSFVAPFSKLVSNDPSVIENRCIESYVRAVLQVAPDYFDNGHNIREFERVVGGKVPEINTINALRDFPEVQLTL